ncbi:MAG: hypothetical protein FD153_1328 [Rhodospirillaceae bacterium]|nr:MAG: hypothetical protein FD153_1328 [Rhodospirillaceae bacterium]
MTARWNEETGLFSADDRLVWAQVVHMVVPLGGERPVSDSVDRGTSRSYAPGVRPPSVGATGLRATGNQTWLDHGDDAHIDRRTATRFRRGRLPIEDRLDLHGLSQAKAHTALRRFVKAAWWSGLRSILVITGKGSRAEDGIGVLRTAVPLWLNEPDLRPKLLSFRHAQPRDGGEGALYLLIRRRRTGEGA